MSYLDDPKLEDASEVAFHDWMEAFEAKLLENLRFDHQVMRELRSAFHTGDDPGLRAAWITEIYLLGKRQMALELERATENYLGAKFEREQDRQS